MRGRKGFGGKVWRECCEGVDAVGIDSASMSASSKGGIDSGAEAIDGDDTKIGCASMLECGRLLGDEDFSLSSSAARATAASLASLRVRGIVTPVNFAEYRCGG